MTTWSRVQGVTNSAGGATSTALTLPSTATNGNIIVGSLILQTSFVTSVTDDKGNPYRIINADGQFAPGNLQLTGFCTISPVTNSPQTITVHYSSSTFAAGMADEFTAGTPLAAISFDGSQTAINAGFAVTSPTFETLQSNDLLYCGAYSTGTLTSGAAGWVATQGSGTTTMSMWKQAGAPSGSTLATLGSNGGNLWLTVFAIAPVATSTWALRQNQVNRNAGSGTTGSASFISSVASGSIVVGTIAINSGVGVDGNISDITQIQDDKGNLYTIVPNYVNASGRAMFWSGGLLTNGPTTITATTGISENVFLFNLSEFIPPPGTVSVALDGSNMTQAGSSSPFTSTALVTTSAGDLLYSFADLTGSSVAPNNGYSSINGQSTTWNDAYLVQSAAGSTTSSWTSGAGTNNAIGLVAIKYTVPPPPPPANLFDMNDPALIGLPREQKKKKAGRARQALAVVEPDPTPSPERVARVFTAVQAKEAARQAKARAEAAARLAREEAERDEQDLEDLIGLFSAMEEKRGFGFEGISSALAAIRDSLRTT